MGDNETKLGATFFIWVAVTVIILALVAAEQFNFIVGAVIAGAAMFGTLAVWEHKKDNKEEKDTKSTEKAKRRSRIEQFVDNLSDDELDDLRARLISNTDGEMVSVEELLTEIDRRDAR